MLVFLLNRISYFVSLRYEQSDFCFGVVSVFVADVCNGYCDAFKSDNGFSRKNYRTRLLYMNFVEKVKIPVKSLEASFVPSFFHPPQIA